MMVQHILSSVRAELVEAFHFLVTRLPEREGKPFDRLKANGTEAGATCN
ncbi:hypothetical protein BH11PSE5_BH11PSE5_32560 [soil metagenome]